MEAFDASFKAADLDRDGRISGAEAVAFFKGSNLPQQVLAQIWMHADSNRTGYLGREEFYNALRLVTVAQSGRQLTPDIVKSALFGPAAAKIPAPRISTPAPASQTSTISSPMPATQTAGAAIQSNSTIVGQQAIPSTGLSQQFFPPGSNAPRPPQATAIAASVPTQGVSKPPQGGIVAGQNHVNSIAPNLSTDWFGGRKSMASVGGTSQGPIRAVAPPVNPESIRLSQSGPATGGSYTSQTNPLDLALSSIQPGGKDSKALTVSGNGFSSGSTFGGDLFSATSQAKQNSPSVESGITNVLTASVAVPPVAGVQYPPKPRQLDQFQSLSPLPSGVGQLQQKSSVAKQDQLNVVQSTPVAAANVPVGPAVINSSQTQPPWPKITQSDVQKYTAVFVKVDRDRDGKITGEEARNLFLSWKLPRDVLRKVWELSDQDKDGMLSFREFCTAVYLMERYREQRPLPDVLPSGIWSDGISLPSTGQFSGSFGGPPSQPRFSPQVVTGSRHMMPPTSMKPPPRTPVSSETNGTMPPEQQKPKIPVLEKLLVDQLSKEEQTSLSSKFQEAADADNKVQELEKEILDSKEKIEFYRTKMQELILYKSRCDNRMNEVSERVSADKREVVSVARKYEDKCKQVGDIASKLSMEEATFHDIQEKKLRIYNTIVKMQKGEGSDESLQDRANKIQSDLEELVKSLNEQCKTYGLRTNPTSLIELPFGWQPGIQEAAAGWDDNWDKFGDDGFTIIKELTVEEENVVLTVKENPPTVEIDKPSTKEAFSVASTGNGDSKGEEASTDERTTESDSAHAHNNKVDSSKSPPASPRGNASENHVDEFLSAQSGAHEISPRAAESISDHDAGESSISEDKYADSWGPTFDHGDDADSAWSFNTKDGGIEKNEHNLYFGFEDLTPIRIGSATAADMFGKELKPFFDSVPSTPAASLFGKEHKSLYDSVPSTPMFNSIFSPRFSETLNPGISPRFSETLNPNFSPRYSEAGDDHTLENFSRFDSFASHENSFFNQRDSFARFDSFHSTTDHDRNENFSRFDSFRSTGDHNRGYSFDDGDPFGSGVFRSSESHSPRHGTDTWSSF